MSIAEVEIYTERGIQLSNARRLIDSDEEYLAALALVAVHSGIAFNDALLAHFDTSALSNDDHSRAADLTEKECKKRRINRDGLRHLRKLVGAKTQVSYGTQRLTQETSQALSAAAARFEAWFYRTMEGLK